jgi:hypothetical protein
MTILFAPKQACQNLRDKPEIKLTTVGHNIYSHIPFSLFTCILLNVEKRKDVKYSSCVIFFSICWVYCAIKIIRTVQLYRHQNVIGPRHTALRIAHLIGMPWSHIWALIPFNRWYFINSTDTGIIMASYFGDQDIVRLIFSQITENN